MRILIEKADCLIYEDNDFNFKNSDVCIDGDLIVSVGKIPESFSAERVIDGRGKLLIPGLINAHTHAYMTIFRNSADDLMFNDWLFGRILPMEDKLEDGDSYWGTMLGICEMIRTGTTCYLDMYIKGDENARAVCESGIRAVLSRGLVGKGNDKDGAMRLREAVDEISRWNGKGNGRLSFMLAPHAPYTCDPDYIKIVMQSAKELGIGINTHLSEGRVEIKEIYEKYGCSPIKLIEKTGMFSLKTVAAHCVHLSDEDIEILAENKVSVATNPVSNLKLANGVAPVPKLLKAGVNVCLGTDGAASNNTLNLFRELSMLTLIHKGVNEDSQAVSAKEGIKIATVNGAAALGLDGIGQIKVGMKADLALIDLNAVNMVPNNNPVAALAYSANGSEVQTVIVNGEILMENRELKGIDEERIRYEVAGIAKRIGA
jgi:5-methylthioadenosine/S-adenosylhomocysteine deaminase